MYMHPYMYVRTFVYICTHACMDIFVCAHATMCIWMYEYYMWYMYMHVSVCVHKFLCICPLQFACMHVYAHMDTLHSIYSCTHMCLHMYSCVYTLESYVHMQCMYVKICSVYAAHTKNNGNNTGFSRKHWKTSWMREQERIWRIIKVIRR